MTLVGSGLGWVLYCNGGVKCAACYVCCNIVGRIRIGRQGWYMVHADDRPYLVYFGVNNGMDIRHLDTQVG
jgi:hypothetical protein